MIFAISKFDLWVHHFDPGANHEGHSQSPLKTSDSGFPFRHALTHIPAFGHTWTRGKQVRFVSFRK
jgi:hypothetical protein